MNTSISDTIKKAIRISLCKSHIHHTLRIINKQKIVVLMYHNFHQPNSRDHINVSLDITIFERQIKYLKKYYNIISLQELVDYLNGKISIPKYSVVLTFDDGYMNNYTLAYPILKKYDVPVSIFLTADFINRDSWIWVNTLEYIISQTKIDSLKINIPNNGESYFRLLNRTDKSKAYKILKNLLKNLHPSELIKLLLQIQQDLKVKIDPQNAINYRMLDYSTIKKMSPQYVEFGSHTLTHPILTKLTRTESIHEIRDSKTALENKINKKIRFFCYPNGDYNNEIVEITSKYYDAALSTDSNFVDRKSNIFTLNRVAAKADFNHFMWSLVHPTT